MGNKKKHISYEERFLIEKLLNMDNSLLLISKALGRGVSTISLEVKRGGGRLLYMAKQADQVAKLSQSNKKYLYNKLVADKELEEFVMTQLYKGVSPESISKMLKEYKNGNLYASPKSIRKYLKLNKQSSS